MALRFRPEPSSKSERHLSSNIMDAFAVSAPGLAELVAAEVSGLGADVSSVEPAGVSFSTDYRTLFRVNAKSRLATRILVRMASFTARDFATLEKRCKTVSWKKVLAPSDLAEVSVVCRKSRLYHSDAVAERVMRVIAASVPGVEVAAGIPDQNDGLSQEAGKIETKRKGRIQRIHVRFERDLCTISADSSGDLLHRRGWRLQTGKAPMRENLASALLLASGWKGDSVLLDPCCGAGTIVIEAALQARSIAPGLSRRFALEFWPGADQKLFEEERGILETEVLDSLPFKIFASDRDSGAIAATIENARRAGVLNDLEIEQKPLSDVVLNQLGEKGWVVTNPPYGIRTGNPATLKALWGRLGAMVRAGGRGWSLGVVVQDMVYARELRLQTETALATTNGGRPVKFVRSRLSLGG